MELLESPIRLKSSFSCCNLLRLRLDLLGSNVGDSVNTALVTCLTNGGGCCYLVKSLFSKKYTY